MVFNFDTAAVGQIFYQIEKFSGYVRLINQSNPFAGCMHDNGLIMHVSVYDSHFFLSSYHTFTGVSAANAATFVHSCLAEGTAGGTAGGAAGRVHAKDR